MIPTAAVETIRDKEWTGPPPLLLEIQTTTVVQEMLLSANAARFGQVSVGRAEVSSKDGL